MVSFSGYMAPEYAIDGLFSIKSDVFSFGVLLLEIVSRKKNKALTYHDYDDQNLIALVSNTNFNFAIFFFDLSIFL